MVKSRKIKQISFLLSVIYILTICACNNSQKQQQIDDVSDQIVITSDKGKQERTTERKKINLEEVEDSLLMDNILQEIIQKNQPFFHKENYTLEYIADTMNVVKAKVNIGNFFSKTTKHLIIHRTRPGATMINIYVINADQLTPVLMHEQGYMTYTRDSIEDINGDNRKDFVVYWYGNSGCCLKAFSEVYLLQVDKQRFSESYRFVNPTFSPKEKLIRGVCYGHPGETEMYKYKWNQERIDTIEYIYFDKGLKGEKTGKIVQSNKREYDHGDKTNQLLLQVPEEYKKIIGFDWFMNNF